MAAPVVAGTVALMLQANPNLTPNLIKAILQYTAQLYPGYSPLRQGAGFLNTLGAVRLAKFYTTPQPGDRMPVQSVWSRQIIWGNHRLKGGVIKPTGERLGEQHRLGRGEDAGRLAGDNIVWGTMAGDGDNIVWGTSTATTSSGARRRRQHRLGHVRRRRQHRLGHGQRRRQHRVGHRLRRRRLRQRRLGHASDRRQHRLGHGRDGDNIVWGTLDGRQHRLGHVVLTRTRPGAAAATTRWSSRKTATEPLPSLDLEFGDTCRWCRS